MENLISPELVRRLCWDWEAEGRADEILEAVDEFLRAGQARPWQRELVDPVLAAAVIRGPDTEAAESG
jgi:ribonuclease D